MLWSLCLKTTMCWLASTGSGWWPRRHDQIPFGGQTADPNPTDRAKAGTKRSLLVDSRGVLLSVVVCGANRHDMKQLEPTRAAIQAPEPDDTALSLCLDKGYDYPEVRELLRQFGWTAHLRSRGDEARLRRNLPGYRARRWVVERTHSWFNRFRRLLVRWEKNLSNFLAMLRIARAYICVRQTRLFV